MIIYFEEQSNSKNLGGDKREHVLGYGTGQCRTPELDAM